MCCEKDRGWHTSWLFKWIWHQKLKTSLHTQKRKKRKKKRKRKKNVAYCFWRSLTKKYAGRTLFNCSNPCCLIISLSGSCKIPQIQASEMSRSDKHGVNNKIMNAESYYAAQVWGVLVFFGHLSQRKTFFLADWLFAHSSSSKGAFKQVSTRHFYI